MKKTVVFFAAVWFCAGLCVSESQAQNTSAEIEHAKDLFWSAKFDSARILLNRIISSAQGGELHDAYLYLGFVASRDPKSGETPGEYFSNAIKASPRRKLTIDTLPPDLRDLYIAEQERLIGCVRITTQPAGADVLAIGDRITPVSTDSICGLETETFQVMVTSPGYEEMLISLIPRRGQTQTEHIELKPITTTRSGTNWWLWATIGGAVAATSTAFLISNIDSNGDQGTTPTSGLPVPPDHPSN